MNKNLIIAKQLLVIAEELAREGEANAGTWDKIKKGIRDVAIPMTTLVAPMVAPEDAHAKPAKHSIHKKQEKLPYRGRGDGPFNRADDEKTVEKIFDYIKNKYDIDLKSIGFKTDKILKFEAEERENTVVLWDRIKEEAPELAGNVNEMYFYAKVTAYFEKYRNARGVREAWDKMERINTENYMKKHNKK